MEQSEQNNSYSAKDILFGHMIKDAGVMRPHEQYVDEVLPQLLPQTQSFEITSVPVGEAPEDIRRAWVGLHLPVRAFLPEPETMVPVLAVDGLIALSRAGQDEATEWWFNFYDTDPEINTYIYGGLARLINPFAKQRATMARLTFMGFRRSEGILREYEDHSDTTAG